MEETVKEVKEFFQEFKHRISSPLFGSFIISWLLINWEIPITLLFYKQEYVYRDFKASYVDAIREYYSIWRCILFPFLTSLFYTFVYPYIRNQIKIFQAARTLEVDSAILKKSGEGFVSIAKHQILEGQLRERMDQLQTFYNNQTQIEKDNEELRLKEMELNHQLTDLQENTLKSSQTINKLSTEVAALSVRNEKLDKEVIGATSQFSELKKKDTRTTDLNNRYGRFLQQMDEWVTVEEFADEDRLSRDELISEMKKKIIMFRSSIEMVKMTRAVKLIKFQ